MPGPLQAGNKLGDAPIALDEKMRRHAQLGNLSEIGMARRVQRAAEQLLYAAGTELPRRQADVMNHQQRDVAARRPRIEMRRWAMVYSAQPTAGCINPHGRAPIAKALS